MGDWVGQLVPDSELRSPRNFYLRFASDQLTESADSRGNEWRLDNSDRTFTFAASGALQVDMAQVLGTNSLSLAGQMDDSLSMISGTWTWIGPDEFPVSGTFELIRSSGPDMYDVASLEGHWRGPGANPFDRTQILDLNLDATGTVVDGMMIRTNLGTIRRTYSAGAATFTFFDSAIGRMENVVLTADGGAPAGLGGGGETSTFSYLLVDPDYTLIGGPGVDSQFGSGIVTLERQPDGGGE